MLFRKEYNLSLNRVHDTVRIREGGETLLLRVDADPLRIVAGLNRAQESLKSIDENTTAEDQARIARFFAGVIFGDKQADELMTFYRDDSACVINVCGRYFADRLAGLITRAQKKA